MREEILKNAIIGTARDPKLGKLAAAEIGLPGLDGEPAKKLLSMAAVERRMRLAGHFFLKKEAAENPVFSGENWPECSPIAARMLRQILGGVYADALPECLNLAIYYQKKPAPASLPSILDIFFESRFVRQARKLDWPGLQLAVGNRGKWLAAQHPEWKTFLENLTPKPADWFEGNLSERLFFINNKRAENPTEARELLEKTWEETPWEHRAQFVATLEKGLSPEDEAFLERVIFDKRKEVRRQAIRLAARIRGGKLAQKIFGFAAESIVFNKKTNKIETFLDKNNPNATVLDILGNGGPAKSGAADATILTEIVALVPAENWEPHFGKSPENLVRLFEAAGFLLAIIEAVQCNFSEKWVRSLVHFWAEKPDGPAWSSPAWAQILEHLPAEVFDLEIKNAFSERHFLLENNSPLVAALAQSEHFWSAEFTVAIFKHLYFWLNRQADLAWDGYYLENFLKKAIWRAEPSVAGQLREIWQTPPRYSPISPTIWANIGQCSIFGRGCGWHFSPENPGIFLSIIYKNK